MLRFFGFRKPKNASCYTRSGYVVNMKGMSDKLVGHPLYHIVNRLLENLLAEECGR